MYAWTKSGTQRLVWQGKRYELGPEPQQVPDALAKDIERHVNIEVSAGKPGAAEDPAASTEATIGRSEERTKGRRSSREAS